MQTTDTIVAISTPLGEGGIGIVRLSGARSFDVVKSIFSSAKASNKSYPEPRKLYFGRIMDLTGELIDEALVSFMPAPCTYTREDIVEINCHSGVFSLRAVLRLVLDSGVRLAEPGEFTKRAFLNGRIDLSRAEAVLGMVRARSEEAARNSARILQGDLKKRVDIIRDKIIEVRAPLEASFDYPEEICVDLDNHKKLAGELAGIKAEHVRLLQGAERGRAQQEGVSAAIIGRPNVGKSSLLNALLRQSKAIVHELPGTTRDIVEGSLILGGYPLILADTAGIQGTEDPVEKKGIERAREAAGRARLLIVVFDGSAPLYDDDLEICALWQPGQGLVAVVNKSDLKQQVSESQIKGIFPGAEVIKTVATEFKGLDDLEHAVTGELDKVLEASEESPVIISMRHQEIVAEALSHVEMACAAVEKLPLEIVSNELQNAWIKLGEISGTTADESLIDRIFSEFCLGK